MSTEEELTKEIKILSGNTSLALTQICATVSNLEARFQQTKDFMYRDVAALQKRCNEIEGRMQNVP